MQWKYVKELSDEMLIKEFEDAQSYTFNKQYIDCVKQNNGGRPSKRVFLNEKGVERVVKSFLSFNKSDRETVWKVLDWNKEILEGKYIPFAIDNFGNIICFLKHDDSIVFIEHETGNVEKIASDYENFISNLRE